MLHQPFPYFFEYIANPTLTGIGKFLPSNPSQQRIGSGPFLPLMINSDEFIVPSKHYFFLGDNRDCSKDSRFLSSVGFVHEDNLTNGFGAEIVSKISDVGFEFLDAPIKRVATKDSP